MSKGKVGKNIVSCSWILTRKSSNKMGLRSLFRVFSEKRSIFDVLHFYFVCGKLTGFTIYTIVGDNMNQLDFQFQLDDFFLYILYLASNVALLVLGRYEMKETKSIIVSFGSELVLVVSLATGMLSTTIIILFRKKILRILKMIHQFDTQVE